MARILAISSQVARGHVGLSVVVPALQALGHEVIALPTIVLSNHPGYPQTAGQTIDPVRLRDMLDAVAANGWLQGIDGVLTGYLPSAAHVRFAADAVTTVRTCGRKPQADGRHPLYLCDPVIGDHPKGLYIDPAAADAVREMLLPVADLTTPNHFELGWLAGARAGDGASPQDLLRALGHPFIVATSMPDVEPSRIRNILCRGTAMAATSIGVRPQTPHGTGDLFAAVLLAVLVEGGAPDAALSKATVAVDRVLAASTDCDMLQISALPRSLDALPGWPVDVVHPDPGPPRGGRRSSVTRPRL